MVTAVIIFALLSALLEFIIVMKFMPLKVMNKPYAVGLVHLFVFAMNLSVHWGTLVGTMTAITAVLVSFGTMPTARMIKTYYTHWREARAAREAHA